MQSTANAFSLPAVMQPLQLQLAAVKQLSELADSL